MCWNRRLLQLACLFCALSSRCARFVPTECFCLLTGRCCCVCCHAARSLCADFSSLVAKFEMCSQTRPPHVSKDLPLGAQQSKARCNMSNSDSAGKQSPSVELRTCSVAQKGVAGSSRLGGSSSVPQTAKRKKLQHNTEKTTIRPPC